MSRPSRAAVALVMLIVGACTPSAVAPSAPPVAVATVAPTASPTPTPTPTATPSPTPIATADPFLTNVADLSGRVVDPVLAHRLPIAVMLDDSRAARPQSGFNAASLVYQATADGYETRYMLVFQEGDTKAIGPVRSARFFLVQWASEVKAGIAHYGGDRRTRRHIKHNPHMFTDIDGMGRGNDAYRRIKSRRAPHNAYASTKSLRAMAVKLGDTDRLSRRLHLRPFMEPVPLAERGASQRIRIPYNTNVITYRYDRQTDRYLRSIDGKAHVDPADDQRVAPTNVVVLFQKFRIDTKIEPGHSRPDFTTIGTGKALVFRSGQVIKATWSKDGDVDPTIIRDGAGVEIPLVRGQTFIQVVPTRTKVTYGD